MTLSNLHAQLLCQSFEHVLGAARMGSMAYIRCLTGDIVKALAEMEDFQLRGWKVLRIADMENAAARTITADRAVEMRESKEDPVLLLVDTARAGAGMDGIFSAAREVQEEELFLEATRLAAHEITRVLSRDHRIFATKAIKKARKRGRRAGISPWTEFDFLTSSAAEKKYPGALLHLVGLWPIEQDKSVDDSEALEVSLLFVNRLLGTGSAAMTPASRIEALRLLKPTDDQRRELESFLRAAATKPLFTALADLADTPSLWVNALRIEGATSTIQAIELVPWKTKSNRISKWSGLDPDESPPVFFLRPDARDTGQYSKLEIRWKARPENLKQGCVEYHIAIVTDMEEELAAKEVPHSAKKEERCRFTDDDFETLSEDALISAKVVVSVIGYDAVGSQESDEFIIRFGEPRGREKGGVGKKLRAFSEGLIELTDRNIVSAIASSDALLPEDSKGFVVLRVPEMGKTFRVFRPPLIRQVEKQWSEEGGAIGRWKMKIRATGSRAGAIEFVPFLKPDSSLGTIWEPLWARVETASRRMADRFSNGGGGVAQIYDEKAKGVDSVVREYLLSWAALLESVDCNPSFALVNTVEVMSLSGRTIGLIVLPSHPLRVAWRVGYDNLAFHARFEEQMTPKEVRDELKALDGAMFPAFLPGLGSSGTFVFGDTLGFHAVGMVLDHDKEPKAALALLARALGETETAEPAPSVEKQSAVVLGKEIIKYLECHGATRLLHLHALRPGDGLTVARALGEAHKHYLIGEDGESGENGENIPPAFVLQLYPSEEQQGIAGRFIAEVCEKRRSGAGVVSEDDLWMLQSLSLGGGVSLPTLQWACRDMQTPEKAAHLAAAFDTFDSRVDIYKESDSPSKRPVQAFGLLSFFERRYRSFPSPVWFSLVPPAPEGEKHPSDRTHTDRLLRIQQLLMKLVAMKLGGPDSSLPLLCTEISVEKAENLQTLHSLCDWVITLDRNAGIEYFDSPRDNRDIYDAYVIDCVPEREDLGCLQLITSTANLEEVRNLLDKALDQMGLSRSRRNAEFLLENLKALSGRLAIRLTGRKAVTSELIALAILHASCEQVSEDSESLVSLAKGFFVPVDDIRDLLPPVNGDQDEERDTRPDLIYISMGPRKGLLFRFVEVKYRRHMRTARDPEELAHLRQQVRAIRGRWEEWYLSQDLRSTPRAIRRAKLSGVLRFYADKARRHHLPETVYQDLTSEIDRMISAGASYSFGSVARCDRGFIFCPEYHGAGPQEISPRDWETRVFLIGPDLLPDRVSQYGPTKATSETTYIHQPGEVRASTEDTTRARLVLSSGSETSAKQAENVELGISSMPASQICLGKDLLSNTEVLWNPTIRGNPHLMVVGLPGMGKTTCLINICRQTLQAGIRPIIFSYHEDIDEQLQDIVGSLRFVDFHGLGFNPLQVLNRESKHGYLDVAGSLRDIFVAIFPELGDVQGEKIRQAIKQSFVEAGWGSPASDTRLLCEPEFKRFLQILREDPKPDRGLRTLLSRLEELEDYGFFDLGEQQHNLWETEGPIVVRIHTTQNDNLQRAFASLIFYGLYKDMFRRGTQDHLTHSVIFDEAHRAASLTLIPTMAKECRKYGISLVLASQEARDFHVSLYSAIANYLVLRLTDVDAKALVRNVASSDQERGLIDRIKQLDRFKALYFSEGRRKPAYVALSS